MNGMTPAKTLATTLGATAALTMLLAGGAMAAENGPGTNCRVPTAADDARLYTPGTNAGVAYENGLICDGAVNTTATTDATNTAKKN